VSATKDYNVNGTVSSDIALYLFKGIKFKPVIYVGLCMVFKFLDFIVCDFFKLNFCPNPNSTGVWDYAEPSGSIQF
jgi:hypothetical protein